MMQSCEKGRRGQTTKDGVQMEFPWQKQESQSQEETVVSNTRRQE